MGPGGRTETRQDRNHCQHSPTSQLPPSHFHSPLRGDKASLGSQQSQAYHLRQDQVCPQCMKAEKVSTKGMDSKKPVFVPVISSGPNTRGSYQAKQLSPTFIGPILVPLRFSSCQSRVCELPVACVSCLCDFPIMILTALAHMIPPPSFQLNSRSSDLCLAVNHCICFHQLLDIGTMMTVRVVTNLITGAVQFRHPLHYTKESLLVSSFWIPENFLSIRLHSNPTITPPNKIYLTEVPYS